MRVLICDDHCLFADAFSVVLRSRGHDVVACVSTPQKAVEVVESVEVDVCIMDLAFPNDSGVDGTVRVIQASPGTKVMVLTGSLDSEQLARAAAAGARGVAAKGDDIDLVIDTLERVLADEIVLSPRLLHAASLLPAGHGTRSAHEHPGLTTRELEVLRRLARGEGTAELARAMGVRYSTARTHIQHTLMKLGVHSKLEAAVYAVTHGLVPNPDPTHPDAAPAEGGVGEVRLTA